MTEKRQDEVEPTSITWKKYANLDRRISDAMTQMAYYQVLLAKADSELDSIDRRQIGNIPRHMFDISVVPGVTTWSETPLVEALPRLSMQYDDIEEENNVQPFAKKIFGRGWAEMTSGEGLLTTPRGVIQSDSEFWNALDPISMSPKLARTLIGYKEEVVAAAKGVAGIGVVLLLLWAAWSFRE